MATEMRHPAGPSRRRGLQALAALGLWPGAAAFAALAGGPPLRLALAWDELGAGVGAGAGAGAAAERTRCLGVWVLGSGGFEIAARQLVPTRAHGAGAAAGRRAFAVARRPGLWLRRWAADGRLLHGPGPRRRAASSTATCCPRPMAV
ncbi:MAG: hypothetical protein U1F53_21430 [Burkholderiaceae bacterium]